METVNQENENIEATKTFTQEEVNSIVAERVGRERAKYADFEELKSKAQRFDEIEEASKTELQKANEKAQELQAKLDSIEKETQLRNIRDKVSAETGIPVNLITGTDEESCMAQAKAIAEFAKPTGYPKLKDGGELINSGSHTTRDQFADWANEIFKK